ncbi:glycosyltransferase family 4 protein [Inconstantimicrobium porci]|uniref:Glycosyltransferase family 4 protein n=1 Tax=Inconstantimicrobium porci TaxID=2652291 RepID=A0A7X2MZ06_9CLOT|nr:glycosyltransferase family 4 protein [Inconstantimicrobium porci]MSR91205.1 glycosyltransferase family 4 protein [Inconstantimicrobium porci]
MKNILYLHAGAEMYGADIVLLELIKGLNKKEYNPYVVLPCEGLLVEKMKENDIPVQVIPYPILRRKYFNLFGIIRYMKDYFVYSKKLKEICANKKIDIIHTNTSAVLEGIYLKKKLDIKHVWHIHEIIMKPKFIHKTLSFLISKYADQVITVSNSVKNHLIATKYFKEDEIKVVYNGVDNQIFNPDNKYDYLKQELNIPNDAVVVGMIGRVNAWKGQNDFLDAIKYVLVKDKNVYAMLVGGVFEGQEWRMTELKDRIKQMDNSDRIILQDYRTDVKNIHCLFDVFVLPSTNPDPLPTVVLESMASGTPVVAYAHGGVCEMVKQDYNGKLVEVGNAKALADAIHNLVCDEKLRISQSINSLERQKNMFSLDSYISNFTEVYKKL